MQRQATWQVPIISDSISEQWLQAPKGCPMFINYLPAVGR